MWWQERKQSGEVGGALHEENDAGEGGDCSAAAAAEDDSKQQLQNGRCQCRRLPEAVSDRSEATEDADDPVRGRQRHRRGREGDEGCSHHYNRDTALARKETAAIRVLRAVVCALLLATAIAASVGVYMYAKNDEYANYDMQYEVSAGRVVESFRDAVERKLGAVHTMSASITSYALAANRTFPFVTVPYFVVKGSNLRV